MSIGTAVVNMIFPGWRNITAKGARKARVRRASERRNASIKKLSQKNSASEDGTLYGLTITSNISPV